MSYGYTDEELEQLKRRKMEQLIAEAEERRRAAEEEAAREAQRQAVLRVILTPEARERLANVKLVKPELAKAVEDYLISAYTSGQLREVIDDNALRDILATLDSKTRRELKIRVKRKGE
ncbi:MAG: DNA-binding protein [Sulfolobales archaeon]|nr:DNA-binding protein [Sulfolobales archaeon]MDW8082288.1 DNA-binding protein [Sulfolobales archaeon]